jgi:hypothetical protein
MCFSIPVKVLSVTNSTAELETGMILNIKHDHQIKKGSYVRLSGNIIVDCLTESEGDSIRQLITELNTNYEH